MDIATGDDFAIEFGFILLKFSSIFHGAENVNESTNRLRSCFDRRPESGHAAGRLDSGWLLGDLRGNCQRQGSGKGAARPELEQCRKALRPGDALIVWRLDRLGRSLPDLVQIVSELEQKDIGFESVTERIETGSAAGKLVFHVFAALADFERNLIRERTNAGLAAARARGRVGGRKPKLDAKDMKEIQALWRDKSIPVADIARRYGVSRTTLYKHLDGPASM